MKNCYGKSSMFVSVLFVSMIFLFASCASTKSADSEDIKDAIEEVLDADITWANDFKVRKFKNLYADEYALFQNEETSMVAPDFFTDPEFFKKEYTFVYDGAKYVRKTMLVKDNSENRICNNDIKELKKDDIFVSPVYGSNDNYIFLIKMRNKCGKVKITAKGNVSVPNGSITHLDRYEGWKISAENGSQDVKVTYRGLIGTPVGCGMDTTIFPWVNVEKGELSYLILDVANKILYEFDLKFLGSYKSKF